MLFIGVLAGAVGFLGSLLGVGGGVFLVPALVIGLNFEPQLAMPISLMCALATAISGSSLAIPDIKIVKPALVFEPFSLIGTLLFSPMAYVVSSKNIMIAFAFFILLIAVISHMLSQKSRFLESVVSKGQQYRRGIIISFVSGSISGLFGIGGGIVLVPLLRLACRIPIKEAMQISLCIMIPTSVVGLMVHSSLGAIPWKLGLAGVVGALPAGMLGKVVRKRLPEVIINRLFVIFAAAVAIAILIKSTR